jgi:hypothetical protein
MLVSQVKRGVEVDSDILSLDESEDLVGDIPYARQFMKFIDEAATRYHGVDIVKRELLAVGYEELKEDEVNFLFVSLY